MTELTKNRIITAVLFTVVITYGLSGEASPPPETPATAATPTPAPHMSPNTILGTNIHLSIQACQEKEDTACIVVVLPFKIYKQAISLYLQQEASI